ncbi:Putative sugar phosphate isomerase YwlF [bacterium HR24]|jgi:ribose 5-phosphate isomerase B|nr:Putative sugar phosphate isomerase YwlF [bacterium HR24]
MRIAVAADHAGLPLKEVVISYLSRHGHEVLDLGTNSSEPVDYPDFARAVGEAILRGEADRGIVICGSGVGASIAANKMRGIRAAVCHDAYTARQGVEHDDMNVLCLGSWVVGPALAVELVKTFISARFSGEERHRRRLKKVAAMEEAMARPG